MRVMAILSDEERAEGTAEFQREISAEREACPVLKTVLRTAYNAADQWREDNAASFNLALPAAFRNNATPKQKARLLLRVIEKHFKVT